MELTNSRAFYRVDDTTLRLAIVKSQGSDKHWTAIDHPVVSAFEKMTDVDKYLASREYLKSINKDFWDKCAEVESELVEGLVTIREDFGKIPAKDWISLLKLYASFCITGGNSDLEVGGLIISNLDTKQLRIVIPQQVVTKASVDWSITSEGLNSKTSLRFLDGEELSYTDFKEKWSLVGITHSHNTMFTSPSGVDDRYEVGTKAKPLPTGVHLLVGSFANYQNYETVVPIYDVFSSVSHGGVRYQVQNRYEIIEEFEERDWIKYTFNPVVLDLISTKTPVVVNKKYVFPTPSNLQIKKSNTALDAYQLKMDGLEDLWLTSDNTTKAAKTLLLSNAYGLLTDIISFLVDDLGEDIKDVQEEIDSVFPEDTKSNFYPYLQEEPLEDFPIGFSDPFHWSDR